MYLMKHWRSLFIAIWPFISLYLTIALYADSLATRCGFVVIVMAGYWASNCIPLSVTGMIPMVSFPVLGIMDSAEASTYYMNEANQFMLCGLTMVFAIEHCKLHERIAIHIVSWVGCKHLWLTFGIFFCSMFLSMWVANVAAVAMVSPITLAILDQLEEAKLIHVYEDSYGKPILPEDKATPGYRQSQTVPSRTTICYFLGLCWSSTIGGVGTLVATTTNVTIKDYYEEMAAIKSQNLSSVYPIHEITFNSWMLFNLPHMLVSVFCVWIALNMMFLGLFVNFVMDEDVKNNKYTDKEEMNERSNLIKAKLKERLHQMGGMTWHEKAVGFLNLLVVCLWIFRKPGFIKGWAWNNMMSDLTPATLVVVLLFVIPENLDFFKTFWNKEKRPKKPGNACMTSDVIDEMMPWRILFLVGGAYTLSKGVEASELHEAIAHSLTVITTCPPFIVMFLLCSITTIFTEMAPGVAAARITLPILGDMAEHMKVNALYFIIPVGVCCSFSFMLPSGTSSNALIFGMINMPEKYMFLAGIAPKIITLVSLMICVVPMGKLLFKY